MQSEKANAHSNADATVTRGAIFVVVNTDMYSNHWPRGSVQVINKDHPLYQAAPSLMEKGHLILKTKNK
jgi:hypothetical protein